MTLRTKDGQELEVKQGILLNSNGDPILGFESRQQSYERLRHSSKTRLYQVKGFPALILAIPLGVLLGLFAIVFGFFLFIFMIFKNLTSKKSGFQQRV